MDCMLGELYPNEAVTHVCAHTRTHTYTYTHTQHGALCSTQAPGNRCSLQTLLTALALQWREWDGQARACEGRLQHQGGPPLLFQGPLNSVPSPLCGENTEEGTVEVVGRGQSNSSALEACSLWRRRIICPELHSHICPQGPNTWPDLMLPLQGSSPKSQRVLAPWLALGSDTGQAMVETSHLVLDAEPTNSASDTKKWCKDWVPRALAQSLT